MGVHTNEHIFDRWRLLFGTVSAGNFNPTNGLNNQSTNGNWWTSSVTTASNSANANVNSTNVNPGTNSNNRDNGFSVRCVFP